MTTYTPGGGRISSLVLQTTTLADGKPHVLTSFVAETPSSSTPTAGDAGASAGPSSTRNPSLQSGAAFQLGIGRDVLAVVGAGVLGAAALA